MAEDHLKPENKALTERVLGYGTARTYNRHEIDRLLDAAREEARSAVSAERPGRDKAYAAIMGHMFGPFDIVSDEDDQRLWGAADEVLELFAHPAPVKADTAAIEKAAYMRGWNDRENEFLGRCEGILPPGSVAVPATPEGPENQQDSPSRNTGNHQCADAGPSPRSHVMVNRADIMKAWLGIGNASADEEMWAAGERLFDAAALWPDGGEAVHTQPSDQAPAEPSSSTDKTNAG